MRFVNFLKEKRIKFYHYMYLHKRIKKNQIIFWADNFKHFGCSPKYIALYLLEHYKNKFEIVWVFENNVEIPSDMPKEIHIVRYFSLEYLEAISTSKFIICNARIGKYHYFNKRAEQVYIQTWHSSIRLKKIEGDAIESLGASYISQAKIDSSRTDLLLSGCDFSTKIFENSFWYNGAILKSGTPRCDILFEKSARCKNKVFDFYSISHEKKLVLYAPTFRKEKKADLHDINVDRLKNLLEAYVGGSWIVGCRFHPNVNEYVDSNEYINMTHYSDMQELLVAADLLITDYSSCMFDMAIANKLCVLYTPDIDNYICNDRGFYFDIFSLPFPITKNMNELEKAIQEFDNDKYLDEVHQFLEKIGCYEDGNASKKVAEYIVNN